MIRMLVSSFYNTLIDKEEAIPMTTMLEIDKLRNNNIIFSISTNRGIKDILYYNHDYPFIDYIIGYNGNYIYDVKKEEIIYSNYLKKKDVNLLEEIFDKNEIILYKEEDKIIKIEIKISKKEINLLDKIKDLKVSKSILKIGKDYYIELTANNTYDGIKKLSKILKIKSNEIISIIGNTSEKEIIDNIDNTYVVSNAEKELKSLAKNKTKSNNYKGVEQVIKKYNK